MADRVVSASGSIPHNIYLTYKDMLDGTMALVMSLGDLPVNVNITSPIESNGAVPVNIQDQHTTALDLRFIQAQGAPTTLAAAAAPEDTTIDLASAVGFVANNVVGLFSTTGIFYFGRQVGAPVGNTITLDTPIDKDFQIGDNVVRALDNMAVNGAAATQIFQIGPVGAGTGVEIDITRILGIIVDEVAMDDGKFGGIAALTNGVVLRQNNDVISNIWNVKTNGDFGLLCYDTAYTDRAPGGENAIRFRNTYAGQDKHGVTIRLEAGDTLEVLIQDDLSALTSFHMMAQGHVVTD
jgi:hypothetical protein